MRHWAVRACVPSAGRVRAQFDVSNGLYIWYRMCLIISTPFLIGKYS